MAQAKKQPFNINLATNGYEIAVLSCGNNASGQFVFLTGTAAGLRQKHSDLTGSDRRPHTALVMDVSETRLC